MKPEASSSLRRTAYAALLAISIAGCQSNLAPPTRDARNDGPVTFNNQVVRIFQRNCQTCHRPGEVAPFPLLAYGDAHERLDYILEAVQLRKMPPWKAVPGYGEFADVRRLSDEDVGLIERWIADGAPEGDQRDLPAPRKFRTGWTLGTPGAVLAMEEPFTVPAKTKDIYRCFTIPIRLASDWRFIRASEVLPGNRKVVHHVQTFIDLTGRSVERGIHTSKSRRESPGEFRRARAWGCRFTITLRGTPPRPT